jgi:hypothetical protein
MTFATDCRYVSGERDGMPTGVVEVCDTEQTAMGVLRMTAVVQWKIGCRIGVAMMAAERLCVPDRLPARSVRIGRTDSILRSAIADQRGNAT